MLLDEDQDYESVFHNPNILPNVSDREKNNALQNSLNTANPKSFEEEFLPEFDELELEEELELFPDFNSSLDLSIF